jgi:hypothetical protein
LRKKSIPGIWKWESKVKLSGKESILAQSGRKHWKTSIRLSEKNQIVELQFGDGPRITMGLNDGVIRPQAEVGVGPEVAAIVSSLVVKGCPSGDDERMNQLTRTLPAGVIGTEGVATLEDLTSGVIGTGSEGLAHTKPQGGVSQGSRKRAKIRSGPESDSSKRAGGSPKGEELKEKKRAKEGSGIPDRQSDLS